MRQDESDLWQIKPRAYFTHLSVGVLESGTSTTAALRRCYAGVTPVLRRCYAGVMLGFFCTYYDFAALNPD